MTGLGAPGTEVLASVVLSLVVLALVWRIDWLVDRYTGAPAQTVADLRAFRRVGTATVLIAAAFWVAEQPVPAWLSRRLEETGLDAAWAGLIAFLPSTLVAERVPVLITLLGTWWAWQLRGVGDDIIERFVARTYDETLAPIVENVWDVAVVAVLVLALLDVWGISVTALLAPAGLIGIAIGFAARESIANFFGSIALYADETYERGDFIELESGVAGTVRDISVRSTAIQTLDGDLVTVPNAELNNATVTNRSAPGATRVRAQVGVTYEADPEEVKTLLRETAAPLSEARPPQVFLRGFGDSAIGYDVFVWIDDPAAHPAVRDRLNVVLYDALTEADIEMPYPRREITVRHADGPVPDRRSDSGPAPDRDARADPDRS